MNMMAIEVKRWQLAHTSSWQNLDIAGNIMPLVPNHLILIASNTESWLSVTEE